MMQVMTDTRPWQAWLERMVAVRDDLTSTEVRILIATFRADDAIKVTHDHSDKRCVVLTVAPSQVLENLLACFEVSR